MKGTKNSTVIIGRLGKNPEVSTTQNGIKIAKFSVATTDGKFDNPVTNWHSFTVFNKTADYVEKAYHKGSLVLVEGMLENTKYFDKDSIERYGYQIKVRSTQLLSSPSNNNTPSTEEIRDQIAINGSITNKVGWYS